MLTNLDFLQPGEMWPPRDKDTQERLERYDNNAKLFKGLHWQVYKDWYKLLREDQNATLEFVLNWPKRLSTLWADLLLGEPPRIKAEGADDFISEINQDNKMLKAAYEVAIDISRLGTGIFKARRKNGRAIIEALYPGIWFPVYSQDNIRDYKAHVLGWTFQSGQKKYLKTEIHYIGQVEHRLFEMEGDLIRSEIELSELYDGVEQIQNTNVDDFLIKPIHNLRTTEEPEGQDDYFDLDSIIQEMETRLAQISKILDKHSDPNMYGPASAMEVDEDTGETKVRGGGRFYPVDEKEPPPGYVTWEGQLTAQFKELEFLIEQFYVLSETSPAAFGQLKQGLAESGSALKRLMLAPLAKVNRIRLHFDPELKNTIRNAASLQGVSVDDIHIEWHDGLPEDPNEKVTQEVQRYSAGLTSLESSIRRLDGLEGEELKNEIERIKNERGMHVEDPMQSGGLI